MTYKNFGSMKVFTSDILTKKHKFIPIKTLYLRNSCYKLKNNIIQEIITSIIRNDFRNCPNLRKKQKILGSMPTMLRNLRVQHLLIGSYRKKSVLVYFGAMGIIFA